MQVTDEMVKAFQDKYRAFWPGSWPDGETSRELLTAALAKAWRGMESAPKSGEAVLVWHDTGCGEDCAVAWFDDSDKDYPWRTNNNAYCADYFDVWQPIIAPTFQEPDR